MGPGLASGAGFIGFVPAVTVGPAHDIDAIVRAVYGDDVRFIGSRGGTGH